MVFGINDSTYIDLPSNIDTAYLRGLQTRAGLSVADMVARMDAGLARVNAGASPLVAALSAGFTTSEWARGGRDSTMKAQRAQEYGMSRPQLVGHTAHMLALNELSIALGFTEDGLNEISLEGFQEQVDAMVEALQRADRADALGRLFSDAEIPVGKKTAATSPGFAGSGTGGNAFAGVYPDGTTLPGGYTHYYRDTTANRAAVVKSARNRLKKWASGPFNLIGSQTSIDALVALGAPDFVTAGSALVRLPDSTAEALVDPLQFVGVFDKDILVWQPLNDFTDDVYALFKSYGAFAANNPLIKRYDALRGRDAIVRSRDLFPLAEAEARWKGGWNVNNRVGAALITIAASGSYTPPVLSY